MFLQASIRAPVGATFVPRTAHLKLIKPRIKTRAGEVIEPMSRYLIPEMIHMNINFLFGNTQISHYKQGAASAARHSEGGLEDCQVAVIF